MARILYRTGRASQQIPSGSSSRTSQTYRIDRRRRLGAGGGDAAGRHSITVSSARNGPQVQVRVASECVCDFLRSRGNKPRNGKKRFSRLTACPPSRVFRHAKHGTLPRRLNEGKKASGRPSHGPPPHSGTVAFGTRSPLLQRASRWRISCSAFVFWKELNAAYGC